jgi:hypothetical protein
MTDNELAIEVKELRRVVQAGFIMLATEIGISRNTSVKLGADHFLNNATSLMTQILSRMPKDK